MDIEIILCITLMGNTDLIQYSGVALTTYEVNNAYLVWYVYIPGTLPGSDTVKFSPNPIKVPLL